jgi:hypothetical protein
MVVWKQMISESAAFLMCPVISIFPLKNGLIKSEISPIKLSTVFPKIFVLLLLGYVVISLNTLVTYFC